MARSFLIAQIVHSKRYLSSVTPAPAAVREYFYHMDTKGQLFLADTKHRNFVTCLKDRVFLNFFFRQLRPNSTGAPPGYRLVSPCGKELNYLEIDDQRASTVFSQLTNGRLCMGGSEVSEPFHPSLLAVDEESGRFYHKISTHRHLGGQLGLLHALLAEGLSDRISAADGRYRLRWQDGLQYEIANLKPS